MNPLDRPIWTALTTRQVQFGRGGALARRFQKDVEPFAAAGNDDESSIAALGKLAEPGDTLLILQKTPSPLPPFTKFLSETVGVQMVAERPIEGARPDDAALLGDVDAPEMIALAELTKPGPFRARTHHLGQFWGIRREGRLVAMAGERMKVPGMSEVSGVCTHPDWRGHGFAQALSAFVANDIQKRGETPFLHAYAVNRAAIRLYERLGFVLRCEMAVQTIALADGA
jgi:predicted GNAT family acetyltransferase